MLATARPAMPTAAWPLENSPRWERFPFAVAAVHGAGWRRPREAVSAGDTLLTSFRRFIATPESGLGVFRSAFATVGTVTATNDAAYWRLLPLELVDNSYSDPYWPEATADEQIGRAVRYSVGAGNCKSAR